MDPNVSIKPCVYWTFTFHKKSGLGDQDNRPSKQPNIYQKKEDTKATYLIMLVKSYHPQ